MGQEIPDISFFLIFIRNIPAFEPENVFQPLLVKCN